jgi:hypothetical protein
MGNPKPRQNPYPTSLHRSNKARVLIETQATSSILSLQKAIKELVILRAQVLDNARFSFFSSLSETLEPYTRRRFVAILNLPTNFFMSSSVKENSGHALLVPQKHTLLYLSLLYIWIWTKSYLKFEEKQLNVNDIFQLIDCAKNNLQKSLSEIDLQRLVENEAFLKAQVEQRKLFPKGLHYFN